jgi:hypothetical protein
MLGAARFADLAIAGHGAEGSAEDRAAYSQLYAAMGGNAQNQVALRAAIASLNDSSLGDAAKVIETWADKLNLSVGNLARGFERRIANLESQTRTRTD